MTRAVHGAPHTEPPISPTPPRPSAAPARLRHVLRVATVAAILVALGQIAATAAVLIHVGYGSFIFIINAPAIAALFVVGLAFRYIPVARTTGDATRRAVTGMVAVFAVTADSQVAFALAPGELALPHGLAGLLVVLGLILIRVVVHGRGRYVVPLVVATPLLMLAVIDPDLRLSWIGVATTLLLYAAAMVYTQTIGLDIERARSTR